MNITKTPFLLLCSFILLFSCKTQKENTTLKQRLTFEIVKTSDNSGYQNSENILINNQSELDSAWLKIFSNYLRKPPIPSYDFNTTQLALIAMGEKPNGAYKINVTSVVDFGEKTVVTIAETIPGKSCLTTSVISSPVQLIKFPKQTNEINFIRTQQIKECKNGF
ncbi:MAG: protease complex subunit PrcB family protein [Flavobacteriales bacterium]|nr:protease complex subunit PrcB family protein [Flavobacteriales bacterium]